MTQEELAALWRLINAFKLNISQKDVEALLKPDKKDELDDLIETVQDSTYTAGLQKGKKEGIEEGTKKLLPVLSASLKKVGFDGELKIEELKSIGKTLEAHFKTTLGKDEGKDVESIKAEYQAKIDALEAEKETLTAERDAAKGEAAAETEKMRIEAIGDQLLASGKFKIPTDEETKADLRDAVLAKIQKGKYVFDEKDKKYYKVDEKGDKIKDVTNKGQFQTLESDYTKNFSRFFGDIIAKGADNPKLGGEGGEGEKTFEPINFKGTAPTSRDEYVGILNDPILPISAKKEVREAFEDKFGYEAAKQAETAQT